MSVYMSTASTRSQHSQTVVNNDLLHRGDIVRIETYFSADGRLAVRREWSIQNALTGEQLGRATRSVSLWLIHVPSRVCMDGIMSNAGNIVVWCKGFAKVGLRISHARQTPCRHASRAHNPFYYYKHLVLWWTAL